VTFLQKSPHLLKSSFSQVKVYSLTYLLQATSESRGGLQGSNRVQLMLHNCTVRMWLRVSSGHT